MGVLQRFERRLSGLVEGAFAKVFKGGVEPVELAGALAREADAKRAISSQRTLVPNEYVVELGPADFDHLAPYSEPLGSELAAMLAEHADEQHYTFPGPVRVVFSRADDLDTGRYRISSVVRTEGRVWNDAPATAPSVHAHLVVASDGMEPPGSAPAGSAQAAGFEQRYPLVDPVVRIGRGTDCQVRLDPTSVSRHHAEVRITDDSSGHYIVDLDSTNGTRVNGVPVAEVRLTDGDRIELGSAVLVYRQSESPRDRARSGRQGGEGSGPPVSA